MTNLEAANCRAWKLQKSHRPLQILRVEWSNVSTDLGVSINGGTWGTPKSMVYNWTSYYNGGKPHFNQMSSLIFSWGPWIPSLRVCFMRRRSKTPRSTEKKQRNIPLGWDISRSFQIHPDYRIGSRANPQDAPIFFGQTHGFLCIFPIKTKPGLERRAGSNRIQQVFLEWGNRSMSHQPCSHVVNGSWTYFGYFRVKRVVVIMKNR